MYQVSNGSGCVVIFFTFICIAFFLSAIKTGEWWAYVIGIISGLFCLVGIIDIDNENKRNRRKKKRYYLNDFNTEEKTIDTHSYFQWKYPQLCLPQHNYVLEDFVNIVKESGKIEVYEKDFSRVEKVSFGCLENPCRLRYESYRVNFVPLFTISCILPGTTQQVEFKYDPNIDGIFNRIVSPGQEIANEGRLLMFIDIRKEALEEWDRMAERRKREEAEAWEKRQMAERIKERHRKRELEKLVRQELIERGEIMVEAKRPPISKDIADAVYQRDGGKCVYCGASENLQFDHIIPFSKGGATTIENLQLLCQKCNLEKSNHIG